MPPMPAFIIGLMLGAMLMLIVQTRRRRRVLRDEVNTSNTGSFDRIERIERRLATVEEIATDPAHRTARAIDALR